MARIVYVDEDGNEISEDQLDQYEPAASTGEQLWDAVKAAPIHTGLALARGGAGLARAAGDIFDSDFLRDYADRGEQRIAENQALLASKVDYEPGSAYDVGSSIAGEIGAVIPSLFSPGGWLPKALTFAGSQAPARYERVRTAGGDPLQAAQATGEGAVVDAALAAPFLNAAFKAGAPALEKIGLGGVYGALSGGAGAPLQATVEKTNIGELPATEELVNQAKTGAIFGGATGVLAGGLGAATAKPKTTKPVQLDKIAQAEAPKVLEQVAEASSPSPEVKPAIVADNPLSKILDTHRKQVEWARMYLVMNPLKEAELPAHSGKAESPTAGVSKEAWAEAWNSLPDVEKRVVLSDGTVKTINDYTAPPIRTAEGEITTRVSQAPKRASEQLSTPQGIDEIVDTIKPGTVIKEKLTPGERTLAGEYISGLIDSKSVGKFNELFIYPRTLANKDTRFAPIYQSGKEYISNVHRISGEMEEKLRAYTDLPQQEKELANAFLIGARKATKEGQVIPIDDLSLAQAGLTPGAIQGVRAVRRGLDGALDIWGDALKAKASAIIKNPNELGQHARLIDQAIADMKKSNYVPFTRFGDRFISVLDKEGDIVEFHTYETNRQWRQAQREFKQAGNTIKVGKIRQSGATGYDFMPLDFLVTLQKKLENVSPSASAEINKVLGDMIEAQDLGRFKAHFKKADLIPGYSSDLQRSIADYAQGLAYSASAIKYVPQMKEMLSKIPSNSPVYKYGLKYIEDLQKPTPQLASSLNKASAIYFLSKPMSGIVNATQTLTTTFPEAWNVIAKNKLGNIATATTVMSQATSDAIRYFTRRSLNPDIKLALDRAVKDGIVSEQAFRELTRMKETPTVGASKVGAAFDWTTDKLLLPFKVTEQFNRAIALSAGYRIGKRMDLSDKALQDFAEEFVNATQFDMSKANRPEAARGWGSVPLQFKSSYTGNYIRFLRDGMGDGNWRRLVASPAAMILLGGLPAVAGVKEVIKLGENLGKDPRKEMNDTLGDSALGRMLAWGAPHALGLANIQGSLGTGDFMPEATSDALVKTLLGPASEVTYFRPSKALQQSSQGDLLGAARYALPELFSGPLAAAKAYRDDMWTTNRNYALAEGPTEWELLLRSIGGQPPRVVEEQVKNRSAMLLNETLKASGQDYNWKLADAITQRQRGLDDGSKAQELVQEIRAKNASATKPSEQIVPNMTQIMEEVAKMQSPTSRKVAQVKGTAKKGREEMVEALR